MIYFRKQPLCFKTVFCTFLLSLLAIPSVFAGEEEIQEGLWVTIGTGKLIDGWAIPDGNSSLNPEDVPLDVEIQRSTQSETLYRIWQPYKTLKEKTGINPNSEFFGQIVFDVQDPTNVIVRSGAEYMAGYQNKKGGIALEQDKEVCATNPYGLCLALFGSFADFIFNSESGYKENKSTYSETPDDPEYMALVTVKSALIVDYTFPGTRPVSNNVSYIYIPKPVEVVPLISNWNINCDVDVLEFTIDGESAEIDYNNKKHFYDVKNLPIKTVFGIKIKDEYKGHYFISSITPEGEDEALALSEDNTSCEVNQLDFCGRHIFNVVIDSKNVAIGFENVSSVAESFDSANVTLTYFTSGLDNYSDDEIIFVSKYGESSDNLVNTADATASQALLPISGLSEGSEYTFFAKIYAYPNTPSAQALALDDATGEPLAESDLIKFSFTTGKKFSFEQSGINANDYLWDSHGVFENDNKYLLGTFNSYRIEDSEGNVRFKVLGLSDNGIPARNIIKGQNDKGMYELNIIMSYFSISHDHSSFNLRKGNKIYCPSGYPIGPLNPEKGYRYALSGPVDFPNDESELDEQNFTYFRIGNERDHTPSAEDGYLLKNKIVYNLLVKIEFEDESYQTPKYITFEYQEDAPINQGRPSFLGTLVQTSKDYVAKMQSSTPENYGGWNTYVEMESTNGGYPYTYTFTPNVRVAEDGTETVDTEYDFALFIDIPKVEGEGVPDYGDALVAEFNELYPYLSFWSADYTSTNFETVYPAEEGDSYVNLNSARGVTKAFPGNFGAFGLRYDSAGKEIPANSSIHLKGLEKGKIYRLTVNEPSVMQWFIPYTDEPDDNPTRYTLSDVLAWVSLMEYEPEVKAYQLVELIEESTGSATNSQKTYYTFDSKKYQSQQQSETTYKVTLDNNDNLVSCEDVTGSIDETAEFKSGKYNFTDKLFVRTVDPEWMKNEGVDARIVGLDGEIIYVDNEEPEEDEIPQESDFKINTLANNMVGSRDIITKKSSDDKYVYAVVNMKDKDAPFDLKNFRLKEGYTYDFRSDFDVNYVYNSITYYEDDGSHVKKEVKKEDGTIEMVDSYKSIWLDNTMSVAVPETHVGDDPELLNPAVDGDGLLAVPTPMFLDTKYLLATDRKIVDKPVKIRVYADDFKDLREGENNYVELDYKISDAEKAIHVHDYDISFPYVDSNMTSDLLGMTLNGNTNPYVRWEFYAENNGAGIYSDESAEPGYYNADLGDIFDKVINKKETAVRHVNFNTVYGSNLTQPVIYDRLNGGVEAEVDLKLGTTDIGQYVNNSNTKRDQDVTTVTNIFREGFIDKNGKEVLAIAMGGMNVVGSTGDQILPANDKDAEDLEKGDGNDEFVELFVVQFDTPIAGTEGNYETLKVFTKEELAQYHYPILILNENFDGTINEEEIAATLSQYKDRSFKFNVRNAYLFPIDNEGLTKGEVARAKAKALLAESDDVVADLYHAVTTEPVEHTLVFASQLSSVISASVEQTEFVKVNGTRVELLFDDVELFTIKGEKIASGCQTINVEPGVYLAVLNHTAQKIVVK